MAPVANRANPPGNARPGLRPQRNYALARRLDYLLRSRLWLQIVLAMIAGVSLGLGLSPSGGAWVSAAAATTLGDWLALPGNVFLAMIQMIVVPLVVTSIVIGICGAGTVSFVRRLGLRIAPWFVGTTCVAVLIGVTLALWIQPGQYAQIETVQVATPSGALAANPLNEPALRSESREHAEPSLPGSIVAIIPANPGSAVLDRAMFQIVILAILLAVALLSIKPERARPILDLCIAVQDVAMKIVSWAMVLAPAAVFGLLAKVSIDSGLDALAGVVVYVGTVLLGLLLLGVFYLLMVALVARRNPLTFLAAVREVQLLAFSTSSSAAVMPLSMKTATGPLAVRPEIAQFVVPLGATVNMDGTALYQVVAALFLVQVFGIDLSTGQMALLAVTTVGASIGSPSTPGVGIVILATILQSIGVPAAGIAMIIGVDRILDMSRTALNVTGDLTACVVMDRWLGAGPSMNATSLAATGNVVDGAKA